MNGRDERERFADLAVELRDQLVARYGIEFLDRDGDARVGLLDLPGLGPVVAFEIDAAIYTLDRGELLAIRDHAGRVEFTTLDDAGEPTGWRLMPPANPEDN